ncbi:c-type cytochrome [Aliidiomarina celeris]|uniref:c-type cytochrome n=1 Tax=Aliidiomarina celeris TaxID=2249428 RepID=UPI000DE88234|nr:cytochrome c [Aliidiomarina celeris]
MIRSVKVLVSLGALLITPSLQAEPFENAAEAVEYRQNAFSMIRANFGVLAGMARNEIPFNADEAKTRAQAVYHLSYIPWQGFVGMGENAYEGTEALPGIWQNKADFNNKAEALRSAAKELVEATESGSMNTIRPKFMAVARSCQQCHEQYRD